MDQRPHALDALQHRLAELITEPSGVAAALAHAGELALLVHAGTAAPLERVSVYGHAYFVRLHDALREDFGALARALGADGFHDLVKTYLMIHPPTRPSLGHAGARLADHLTTPPFGQIFARRCPYAADLARLEWAIAEAFTAPDAPSLAREQLAIVPPDAWATLRFVVSPSLVLLDCAWPVQRVRECFEAEIDATGSEEPALSAEPTTLRVWRRDERVRYAAIPALERDALAGVRAGDSFAALCERVSTVAGEEGAAAHAAGLLATWITDGLLVDVGP